jgi:ATP-dependent DNA helicase RecG
LRARGLADGDQLTIAGTLLFAEMPQAFFPEAYVRVLRYHGQERGSGARQQLIEDIRVEGPIPKQLLEARRQVERLQPVRRALLPSGRFGDVALVPEDAWLEGLVNAVIHRSYGLAGDHIRVEIFDDRIEISSPGRFPGLVDLEEPLKTHRFARNPRIARVCSDLNFGQELGEGIRRIFEEMRHAGLIDPVYRQTAGSVELTLLAEPVDRLLAAGLPDSARAITGGLRSAGRLSTGEIVELIGLSRPVVQRELAALREAEIIEWVGKSPKDPRAYWKLATR